MVRMPRWIPVLDRKLLRDVWEMKGQAMAIAAEICIYTNDRVVIEEL